jgi:membrane fusion protein, multidrug efflux system
MKEIFVFTSFCVLLLCATSCKSHKEEKEKETRYLVTSPLLKDTAITREYVCQISSIQHIELRALEKGYLQNIFVDEGKFVRKGQLMFQIMPLLYQAELQKAQAEASFAEIEYLNTKALADSNIVSKNELAMAKAKFDKAKAELALARVHLGFTQIRAPFDGILDRFHVRLGSLVNEGDLLTTLADNSEMWVYFNVPEAEYLDYKANAPKDNPLQVDLKMANHRMFKYTGVVKTIEADFNNETGNIAFRATFPNPEGLLRHGETGNVMVTVPLRNALIVPQKATFEVLDKKYVYVLDKDNVLKSRKITIGAELPDLYVVQEGLKEDDKILLEGLRIARENDKIKKFEYHKPEQVISNLAIRIGPDDDIFILFRIVVSSLIGKHVFNRLRTLAVGTAQPARRAYDTLLIQRLHYIFGGEIVCPHPVGIQPYTHSVLPAAQYPCKAYSIYPLQLRQHVDVGIVECKLHVGVGCILTVKVYIHKHAGQQTLNHYTFELNEFG